MMLTNDLDKASPFPVVGIGASAGGLEAFSLLLSALPADTGMAFVLVQHLAPTHSSSLAEILGRTTSMPVREVQDEPTVLPNHVYVIPPARDMIIAEGKLLLSVRKAQGVHHTINQFFRSLAEDCGHNAIGVVLSGTATDGTLGLEAIKAQGGITFAQDSSARYEGMPHSAIASGIVDFVLAPDAIAAELVRLSRLSGRVVGDLESGDHDEFLPILEGVREYTGVDFARYKPNTVRRRVTRRMLLHKVETLRDYRRVLETTPAEYDALCQDILVGVTSFFRDPDAFEALKTHVFPQLLANRGESVEPVRLWSVGCSTGQEAYSLAIAFVEFAESVHTDVSLQVFATDLNAKSVDVARHGLYRSDIAHDVSPERLQRFFVASEGHYRIATSLRERCVFSRHNVIADPPFSRVDLVACRNLLIYLQPVLQQRVLPNLHYALKPGGFLWLGHSDALGTHRNLFTVVDGKHKVFARRPGPSPLSYGLPATPGVPARLPLGPPPLVKGSENTLLNHQVDRILATKFVPPGVLVTDDFEILQFKGDTSPYLTPTPGTASLSLLKMLREGLAVAVRAAVRRASTSAKTERENAVHVRTSTGYRQVAVEVIPVGTQGRRDGYLILFDDGSVPRSTADPRPAPDMAADEESPPQPTAVDLLTRELAETRDYLQVLMAEQESATDGLQSAHEEVQSANEELQSINEELETSKEEIQSTNEELVTVNAELHTVNDALQVVNDDLSNLIDGVDMAIIILDDDLRLRRFTPVAEQLLSLSPTDIGRRLTDLRLNLGSLPEMEPLLRGVLTSATDQAVPVLGRDNRWYSLRIRPYRTPTREVRGLVIVLVDVDTATRAQEYTSSIVATLREPILVLDGDFRVVTASRAFYTTFDLEAARVEGRLLIEIGDSLFEIPELRRRLRRVMGGGSEVVDFEAVVTLGAKGERTLRFGARRLVEIDQTSPMVLLAIEDVTDSREATARVSLSEQRYRSLVQTMTSVVWTADGTGRFVEPQTPWEAYTGQSRDEYFGYGWLTALHQDDRESARHRWAEAATAGQAFRTAGRMWHAASSEYRRFEARAVPIFEVSGAVREWVGTCSDVEDARRADDALRESDLRKDEFMAVLGHELRNPLAPIRNAVQVLLLSSRDDTVLAAARMMDRQVTQMAHLVDDLLDLSRIRQGKIALKKARMDISSAVRQAVEAVRPQISSSGQTLSVSFPEQPLYINGDALRLAQVVGNLLDNASKFSPTGAHVTMTVEAAGSSVVLRVSDTGIGIASDDLTRVFEMFTQLDKVGDRAAGGLGIGLTLVRSLVKLHDGTISVESVGLGHGSEVVVQLPLDGITSENTPPTIELLPDSAPQRVLIVDDNRDAAESLAYLLSIQGHETRVAHDGHAALEVGAAFQPGIVLLDIGLPGIDGYEVARRMRRSDWGAHAVLVAVTGWGQDSDRQKSQDAGFNHHLVKPVSGTDLARVLRPAAGESAS